MINKLQIIQNAAARIVTFTKKTDHITPVLCKLYWLQFQYRIIFKILLSVYKGLKGLAPAYISELLHYHTSSRLLRSASQRLLSIPRTSLKTYGDRAFSAASPKLWNELPLSLRSSNTLAVFKKDFMRLICLNLPLVNNLYFNFLFNYYVISFLLICIFLII